MLRRYICQTMENDFFDTLQRVIHILSAQRSNTYSCKHLAKMSSYGATRVSIKCLYFSLLYFEFFNTALMFCNVTYSGAL